MERNVGCKNSRILKKKKKKKKKPGVSDGDHVAKEPSKP